MAQRIIQTADLSVIENNLARIHENIGVLNGNISQVDSHIDTVEGDLAALTQEFKKFVNQQMLANRAQQAETRVVQLRQELDKRFGHYDAVRRTAIGILQATDLGIIRQEIISTASENLMLSTPGYWLAPCLVALAAWITDNRELAEKAVREAMVRDDEKTALFFALVCRRADRKIASLKWVRRYLAAQDEQSLDRKTVLVLTAYANGLWGSDTEGQIAAQIREWRDRITAQPEAVEAQRTEWARQLQLKRPRLADSDYTYLPQYSADWDEIRYVLEGAHLHAELLKYFTGIFDERSATGALVTELDKVLTGLVTNFEDEEVDLRRREALEQLVIDCGGDEAEAKKRVEIVDQAFEARKDFLQLLTDTALSPEAAGADIATQKFAISLSKDWLLAAYGDIVAENRSRVPRDIHFALDDFSAVTTDGHNERELLADYDNYIDEAQRAIIAAKELNAFAKVCGYLRIILGVLAVIFFILPGQILYGLLCAVVAYYTHKHYDKKNKIYQAAKEQAVALEERRGEGQQLVRAICAEVVDMRREFADRDAEDKRVTELISGLEPNQFVARMDGSTRRINTEGSVG